MDELKARSAEQARLAAISAGAITPEQEKALNRSMEATVRRKLEAEALGQGAAEAFAKKRYAAAEQLYRTLLDFQPAHVPALVNLGTILLQRNKAEEAIEYLKKATELDAASSPAWFMMGVAQYRAGQDQHAIASLTETVRLDPANAPALLYLGNLETSAGNYEKAVGHFENALKIQPESPDAHFNLAWTYSRLGRTAQARKSYDAAIRSGGLPDSDLELAITGTTTLPRKKQAPDKAPSPAANEDEMRLAAAVSDPSAIPHDAYEVPAHVGGGPQCPGKPSARAQAGRGQPPSGSRARLPGGPDEGNGLRGACRTASCGNRHRRSGTAQAGKTGSTPQEKPLPHRFLTDPPLPFSPEKRHVSSFHFRTGPHRLTDCTPHDRTG